ncbi:putative F-box protein At1g65770 [Euphorbia lathyris]|uniref:putative F-box protein At1g65770 n=1 Tax=Euphorbia lathyris TaxID=212925 RepID=UPI003313CF83
MSELVHQWAYLPKELVENIAERLKSPIDILRLRAVCTLWRSSATLPSFDEPIPRLILNLPVPLHADSTLSKTSIGRIELTNRNPNSSSQQTKGWLTEIRQTKTGKLQLLHPISGTQIRYSSIPLISSSDLHFVQLYEAFKLELANPDRIPLFGVHKVVPFPNDVALLAIFVPGGKLGYWKYEDKNWKFLDHNNIDYDDIIEFKGQVYVVNRFGTIFWVNPLSLSLIQYSPVLVNGGGGRKSLVESCGDLYLVDRYLDRKRNNNFEDFLIRFRNSSPLGRTRRKNRPKAIDFKVYKLDEEIGRWLDVKCLGDKIFVLNMDCSFSISSSEFVGGKGNCIYFSDDDEVGLIGDLVGVRVFLMEDGSIKKVKLFPEYSKIFLSPNIGLQ